MLHLSEIRHDDLFIIKKQSNAEHLLERFMNTQPVQIGVGEARPPKQPTHSLKGLAT